MRDFLAEVRNNFVYHKVNPLVALKMEELRAKFMALALEIMETCPETRDRTLSITHLEDSMTRAIASLARQEPVGNPGDTSAAAEIERQLNEAVKLLQECRATLQEDPEKHGELIGRIWEIS